MIQYGFSLVIAKTVNPAHNGKKIQFHSSATKSTINKMNRAVFLDRDGTLIVEKNYLHRVEEVEIFPGAGAALKRLAQAGYKLFIVTNQSGIGRGYFTLADAEKVNQHMSREFARE